MWQWMIHHFTLKSNWQSTEWTATGESSSKQSKTQISASNVLASIFWDAQGILFIDYFEKGRTINSENCIALLVSLKEKIAKKWSQMKKKHFFTKTMQRITSWSQRCQSYMNCTSNCFRSDPILQIWLPMTTGNLQTSKECSRERDLAPMKKWYRKRRRIFVVYRNTNKQKHNQT